MAEIEKSEFFPKRRRELVLVDCFPKLNSETEKRILLAFKMPLTSDNLMGAPHQVMANFETVAKLDNAATSIDIATEFEGVGVEFFGLPEHVKHQAILVAATMRRLQAIRSDKGDVFLLFNTTVPWSTALWKWAGEMLGCTVFADFHVTEPMLPGTGHDAQNELQMQSDEAKAAVDDIPVDQKSAAAGEGGRRRRGRSKAGDTDETEVPAVQ